MGSWGEGLQVSGLPAPPPPQRPASLMSAVLCLKGFLVSPPGPCSWRPQAAWRLVLSGREPDRIGPVSLMTLPPPGSLDPHCPPGCFHAFQEDGPWPGPGEGKGGWWVMSGLH